MIVRRVSGCFRWMIAARWRSFALRSVSGGFWMMFEILQFCHYIVVSFQKIGVYFNKY